MAETLPKTVKQWNVTGFNGFKSLTLSEQPVPEIGDTQVLVKSKFRCFSKSSGLLGGMGHVELTVVFSPRCSHQCRLQAQVKILRVYSGMLIMIQFRDILIPEGKYPWAVKPNVVPGSDGAGTVLAIGKDVTRFKPVSFVSSKIRRIADSLLSSRTVGAFSEEGLVSMPNGLTFIEAATLSCSGITAWNALFGLLGKQVTAGDWVLTQGTGGVS